MASSLRLSIHIALIALLAAPAQGDPVAEGLAQGRAFMEAGELAAAAETYRAVTRAAPEESSAWLGLAMTLLEQADRIALAEALAAMATVERLDGASPFLRFNQACAHALLGESEAALARLEEGVAAGFANLAVLENDGDLDSLRGESRFASVLAAVRRRARPCEHDPRYLALDFWLGEWEVYDSQGRLVGLNSIQRLLSGCLILENWRSSGGGTGKSVNYYDPGSGRWHQDWVDASGQVIHYEGEFKEGAMRLSGTLAGADGAVKASRMILAPGVEGVVRQVIETSADGGSSWQLWFQGEYRRRPEGRGSP